MYISVPRFLFSLGYEISWLNKALKNLGCRRESAEGLARPPMGSPTG